MYLAVMLTVQESAHRTGRSPETIRRWIREGRLQAKTVGGRRLVTEADLAAAIERPRSLAMPAPWRTSRSGTPAPDWVEPVHEARKGR